MSQISLAELLSRGCPVSAHTHNVPQIPTRETPLKVAVLAVVVRADRGLEKFHRARAAAAPPA